MPTTAESYAEEERKLCYRMNMKKTNRDLGSPNMVRMGRMTDRMERNGDGKSVKHVKPSMTPSVY